MSGAPPRLTTAQLEYIAQAAAAPGQPGGLLGGIARIAATSLGAGLVTAMRFDEDAMEVERVFSSDPGAYPIGGRKRKRDTPWGRQVLVERRPFIGEGEAAIRDAFDDHALILGLGLRSCVNIPIVFGGRCLGTLNVLTRRDRVTAEEVALCRDLARLATPALQPARAGL